MSAALTAFEALEQRVAVAYRCCCGLAPKQAVGEILDVMRRMPEWAIVRAALDSIPAQTGTPAAPLPVGGALDAELVRRAVDVLEWAEGLPRDRTTGAIPIRIAKLRAAVEAHDARAQQAGAVSDDHSAALQDLQYVAGYDAGFMAGERGDNQARIDANRRAPGAREMLRQQAGTGQSDDQTMRQRDAAIDMADKLAAQVARITGADIGEHSSDNCPHRNALDAAAAFGAGQAVPEYTPGSWTDVRTLDEMEAFYMSRLPAIREAAREHGYAIGLHGSARRDFDLLAMPWRDGASDKNVLAHAIAMAACGITGAGDYAWESKPAGRFAVSICICWGDHANPDFDKPSIGHIDLSVIEGAGQAVAVPVEHECDTCKAVGTADETLGGEHFSNPEAPCPDCGGKGYWIARSPVPASGAESVDAALLDWVIENRAWVAKSSGGYSVWLCGQSEADSPAQIGVPKFSTPRAAILAAKNAGGVGVVGTGPNAKDGERPCWTPDCGTL